MFTLCTGAFVVRGQSWSALDPDDPWPKYGHNERNSCRSPYRGPHSEPELRWWAELPTGVFVDGSKDGHLMGPAIGVLNGVRCVLIGTREEAEATAPPTPAGGHLLIFRFFPTNPANYDPFTMQAVPCALDLGPAVNSTPLILPSGLVVVQTQADVQAWDLSNWEPCDCESLPTQAAWVVAGLTSNSSSPTYGLPARDAWPSPTPQIFVEGIESNWGGGVFAIDEGSGTLTPLAELPGTHAYQASPALGPIEGESETRNFVYAGTQDGDSEEYHLFAVPADGSAGGWVHTIVGPGDDECGGCGAMGSPGVFDWDTTTPPTEADLFLATDDAWLWGFDNTCALPDPPAEEWLWRKQTSATYISSTAALTPDRYMVFWSETPTALHLWLFERNYVDDYLWLALGMSQWIHGAPALDSWGRVVINTPSPETPVPEEAPEAGRIICYAIEPDPDPEHPHDKVLTERWRYPEHNYFVIKIDEDPEDWPAYFAPVALDQDGTVICVGWTGAPHYQSYLFALRPPLGLLNGDGASNWDGAPALIQALLDPEGWEEQYGAVYGINLLGAGDANNDGEFNHLDIPGIRDQWDANGGGEDREGQWDYYRLLIDELIEYFAQEEDS
jgi:hypothetical protein